MPSILRALFLVALASPGWTMEIEWSTIDGGGVQAASAGPYTLSATLAQHDASQLVSVDGLTLGGGFWPVVTLADLEVTATVQSAPVIAGTSVDYSVDILNRGAATTSSTLTIDLPPELTAATTSGCAEDPAGISSCTLPMLSPGESTTVDVQAQAAGILPPTLSSDFSIAGEAFESDAADNAVVLESLTGADTALTLSSDAGPEPIAAGETITYAVTVANGGPSDDPATTLVSQLDAALSCGWTSQAAGGASGNTDAVAPDELDETLELPAGGSVSYTIDCALDPAHRADLVSQFDAGSSVDPADQIAVETTTGVIASADAALSLAASDLSPDAGQIVEYEVVITNEGPSSAFGVQLAATLSDGLSFDAAGPGCSFDGTDTVDCSLGDVPPGSEVVTTIAALNQALRGPREMSASVTAATPDPDTGNNSATVRGFSAVPIPVASLPGRWVLMIGLLAIGLLALRRVT